MISLGAKITKIESVPLILIAMIYEVWIRLGRKDHLHSFIEPNFLTSRRSFRIPFGEPFLGAANFFASQLKFDLEIAFWQAANWCYDFLWD